MLSNFNLLLQGRQRKSLLLLPALLLGAGSIAVFDGSARAGDSGVMSQDYANSGAAAQDNGRGELPAYRTYGRRHTLAKGDNGDTGGGDGSFGSRPFRHPKAQADDDSGPGANIRPGGKFRQRQREEEGGNDFRRNGPPPEGAPPQGPGQGQFPRPRGRGFRPPPEGDMEGGGPPGAMEQRRNRFPGGGPGGQGAGAGFRHGFAGGPQGGLFGRKALDLSSLNLSDEQKQRIQQIRGPNGAKARELKKQLAESRGQMRDMLFDPSIPDEQIQAKRRDLRKLQDQAEEIQVNDFLAIRKVLTPEQRQKLSDLKPTFGKRVADTESVGGQGPGGGGDRTERPTNPNNPQ